MNHKHITAMLIALVCMVLIVLIALLAAPARAVPLETEITDAVWRRDVPLSGELQDALLEICEEHGIDPLLALGLIETESGFKVDAVSRSGDYGLCQLNHNYFRTNMTPEENMAAGIGLLAANYKRYGSIEAALTAYNRGHDDGNRSYAGVVLKNAEKWGYDNGGQEYAFSQKVE